MPLTLREIQPYWETLQPIMTVHNERDYDRLVQQVNALIDEIGSDENHPMYEFLDTLGTILHAYEEKTMVLPEASGAEILRYLMDEHGLKQSDLPEVGSQGVVSEILNGKRELNTRQIRELAQRFHVSPAVFF